MRPINGKENVDNVPRKFDEYLGQRGKRRTAERFAILDAVMRMRGHFSADSLSDALSERGFPVSRATVYSNLELLVDFGLLVKQRFSDRSWFYEKSTPETAEQHHHLICSVCGKVKEVKDPLLSRQIESRRFHGFIPAYYTLYIYGVCSSCSRRRKVGTSHKSTPKRQ